MGGEGTSSTVPVSRGRFDPPSRASALRTLLGAGLPKVYSKLFTPVCPLSACVKYT